MSTELSYWSLDGVIDALVVNLRARPGLVGIQVEDSWPGDSIQQKCIWIDDAQSNDDIAGMRADPARYNEVYSLFVMCDVYIEGGTSKQARDELTPLVGEVMREVAVNKRVNIAEGKSTSVRVAGWKYRPYIMKEGRGVACRIELRVSGRR